MEKLNQKKKMVGKKIVEEEYLFNENNSFQEYMMNYASNNTEIENEKEIKLEENEKEIKLEENVKTDNNKVRLSINLNNELMELPEHKKDYRIWWAFKKDWELIERVNQIRSIKEDVIVKKNKHLHSSQLNEDQKKIYQKGKLFRLETEQDDELYYRIKI